MRTSLTTVDVLIGGESKRRAPRAPGRRRSTACSFGRSGAEPGIARGGRGSALEVAGERGAAVVADPSALAPLPAARVRPPRSGGRQLRALTRQADALERQRLVLVKAHRLQLVAEIGRGRHHAASAAGVLLTSDDGAAGSSYCSTSSWLTPLRRRPLAGRGVDREPLRQLLDPEAGAAVEGVAVARQPQRAVGRADL